MNDNYWWLLVLNKYTYIDYHEILNRCDHNAEHFNEIPVFGSNQSLKGRCSTTWDRELSPSCHLVSVLCSFQGGLSPQGLKISKLSWPCDCRLLANCNFSPTKSVFFFFVVFFWSCCLILTQHYPVRQMKHINFWCVPLSILPVFFFFIYNTPCTASS